jgi:hypothetical protein
VSRGRRDRACGAVATGRQGPSRPSLTSPGQAPPAAARPPRGARRSRAG